jgi:hypothetical protein
MPLMETKTRTRTTRPLPRTRLKVQRSQRNEMRRLLSTVTTLHFFARRHLTQSNLPVAIRKSTQTTKLSNLTPTFRGNCPLTSARRVQQGRGLSQCTRRAPVDFVTSTLMSAPLLSRFTLPIAANYPDTSSRTYYPVRLVVGLLYVFILVPTATQLNNRTPIRRGTLSIGERNADYRQSHGI